MGGKLGKDEDLLSEDEKSVRSQQIKDFWAGSMLCYKEIYLHFLTP